MRRLIAGLLWSILGASHAWAWGSEGHRIIAEIAEQYLEPTTATDEKLIREEVHGETAEAEERDEPKRLLCP